MMAWLYPILFHNTVHSIEDTEEKPAEKKCLSSTAVSSEDSEYDYSTASTSAAEYGQI